jgi:phosphopantothenoylcysteine decarboxylase/phosphopantothenate--cysteine ligase
VAAAAGKLKKDLGPPEIVLEPTVDILAALGAAKAPGQVLVGFAAETADVVANAQGKLTRKCLDLIVANDVSAPGTGFQHDTNSVTIIGSDGILQTVQLTDKRSVARALIDQVVAVRTGSPAGERRATDHQHEEHK